MFAKNGPTFIELIQQSLTSTRRGYDLLAPKFDTTPFRTSDTVLAPAIAVIGPIDSALDICCGTGAAMLQMRPLCQKRLVGIDFSPGMLDQAKINLSQVEGKAALEFVEADVLAMNFHAEFDAITCFGALGHILPHDQHLFLHNIYRALRPGGRFVFVTGQHPPFFSFVNLVLLAFNIIMTIRNALLKPPFIMYYMNFLLPEVVALLEIEGFAVEVTPNLFAEPFEKYQLVIATR